MELHSELIKLVQNFDVLSKPVLLVSNYIDDEMEDFEDEIEDEDYKSVKCMVFENFNCKLCINCAMKCAYTLLTHSSSFSIVYLGIKLFCSCHSLKLGANAVSP